MTVAALVSADKGGAALTRVGRPGSWENPLSAACLLYPVRGGAL